MACTSGEDWKQAGLLGLLTLLYNSSTTAQLAAGFVAGKAPEPEAACAQFQRVVGLQSAAAVAWGRLAAWWRKCLQAAA